MAFFGKELQEELSKKHEEDEAARAEKKAKRDEEKAKRDEESKTKKKAKEEERAQMKAEMDALAAATLEGQEGGGSGADVQFDMSKFQQAKEKNLPEGSSSGTETKPIAPEVQEEVNTSNDVTRQEKAQIKEAADEAKDYAKENNLVDAAKEASDKYNLYTANIDTHYTDGLPRTIIQAWKNGRFGEPGTKDAKKIRNALLTNEVGTMLSNMGAGVKGGEQKEGLWTSSVRKNMEEADKRNNEKFETTMKDQLAQYNLGADEQIELEKHINEVMADSTMAVAAKHANNVEDTIGLWHLKQALGNEWGKMSKKQQRDFLNAVNAIQNGDTASAKAILQTSMPEDQYNQIQQNMAIYAQQQAKAQADIASKDASVRGVQNAMGIVNSTLSAFGTIGDAILP